MRDPSRPLSFRRAAAGAFDLALDGTVWSRRTLWMAVLLGLPVVFGVLYRVVLASRLPPQLQPFDLYGTVVVFYYLRNLVPLTALFYASALVADEVEGKTLTYLVSRPVTRGAILAGKFAAYFVTVLCVTLPAVVLTFFIVLTAGGSRAVSAGVPDLFRDLAVLSAGLLVYGALFTLFGVALRRPILPGLLFVFLWELLANLPGYLPRLTVTAYLRSLVTHRPPEEGIGELFGQVLPAALCVETLAVMTAVFLGGAIWIFSWREYVFEQ
jgi:ABC-type transport system involved in multi-copper enzyme maturation permease subunit